MNSQEYPPEQLSDSIRLHVLPKIIGPIPGRAELDIQIHQYTWDTQTENRHVKIGDTQDSSVNERHMRDGKYLST